MEEEPAEAPSRVALHPGVRTALIGHQRAFRQPPGLVADGRDMGTVVFPDATLKVCTIADGAAEHCGADNGPLIVDYMTDWVASKLGASPNGV